MNVIDFTTDMVRVVFDGSYKQYTFKLPKSLIGQLKVGDIVVVQCKDKRLELCKVVEVNASVPPNITLSWVICKVDMTEAEHREQVAQRKEYLKEKLEEKKKAIEERAIWEMLKSKDTEAAALIEELENLCE